MGYVEYLHLRHLTMNTNILMLVLDWEGNLARIKESILIAKKEGATLRVGPELEITGYGLLDHFLESDVFLHSWEMVARILSDRELDGIIFTLGLPVRHRNNSFNCQLIACNGQVCFNSTVEWDRPF
jgi:NAD+ synthase (glutamine-hydrolysing)